MKIDLNFFKDGGPFSHADRNEVIYFQKAKILRKTKEKGVY